MTADSGPPPTVTRSTVGQSAGDATQGQSKIERFDLVAGGLRAVVLTAGARLTELWAPDRQGTPANVVVSDGPSPGDHEGATIGRFANRIAAGRFTLDGADHQLAINNGPNHLHGGNTGFHARIWASEAIETNDHVGVRLTLRSPDGDEAYPGTVDVEATYLLTEQAELVMEYRATTDAPTPLNMTNHAYWNLTGHGSIDSHELQLGAGHVLLIDDELIPVVGAPSAVADSRFDFRVARPIDTTHHGGYDHCFVLDQAGAAAALTDAESGRRMTVQTTQPALQLYTANHFDPPHTAVALEAQGFPDSPNRADFPSTVLRPGAVYHQRTTHVFDQIA